jgi:glycosyltransferase involved in cell wall biosynthesis
MKPTIICLTPVRNNANFLDRFLLSASLWADNIIICDQMSTDGSREIAQKYSKVILIDNPCDEYNERERAKLLIDEARKIDGPRLLITLDADEMFTPNILKSDEWQVMLNAKLGTIFKFQWANFHPDLKTMWLSYHFPWGYMDDGSEHTCENKMHVTRIPFPLENEVVQINEIKVIHFQFTDWEKMQSKQRWYQCLETINHPNKSPIEIFRQYHHMYAIPKNQIIPIPKDWIEKYMELGINILSVIKEESNWFENQTFDLLDKYGSVFFKKIYIWDIDWSERAKLNNRQNDFKYLDPRSIFEKVIFLWLKSTQSKLNIRFYRRIDKILKLIF